MLGRLALLGIIITVGAVAVLTLVPTVAFAAVTSSTQIVLTGSSSPAIIAASPNGAYVAVSNQSNFTVSIVDTSTNAVVTSSAFGSYAGDLLFSPDSSKIYMSSRLDDKVLTLNVPDLAVLNTVNLPVGSKPNSLALNATGSHLYVGSYTSSGNIYKIVTASGTATDLGSSCNRIRGLVLTPDENSLYASCQWSNAVAIFSIGTGVVSNLISVGVDPNQIRVGPSFEKIYVANEASNTISVISTATNTVTGTIATGSQPRYITLSPDGSTIAVSRYYGLDVVLFDTASLSQTQVLANVSSSYGQGVVFAPNGAALWEVLSIGELTKWVVSPPLYTPAPTPNPTTSSAAAATEPTLSATGLDATPYFLISGALVGAGVIALAVALVLRRRALEKSE